MRPFVVYGCEFMKKTALFLALLLIFSSLAGCKKKPVDETPISTSESATQVAEVTENTETKPTESLPPSTAQPKGEPSSSKTASTAEALKPTEKATQSASATKNVLDEIETSEVVTYYCDNVNNRYICMVADKYGVEKTSLIALIKVNSVTGGATVLEFSGKTDENGQLVTTEDELKAVYEAKDDGTVKKATGKLSGNDGCSSAESLAAFMLTKKYIIPSLDEMKRERYYTGE